MFNLTVSTSTVATDNAGRPREIRMEGERLRVTGLESVRAETAAYPVETGPRTVFVVTAAGRRYKLVHLLRARRWTVEPLGPGQTDLASAA
jgi:hypothetical protein